MLLCQKEKKTFFILKNQKNNANKLELKDFMKISVITVCRNAENTVEETILSVVNQAYDSIEYIIIDGASTDNTVNIVEKYRDKISYFISEPDSGIYNAMNKGIKVATGDILYFLNANDSLYDNYVLENIVKIYEKNKNIDIVFGDVLFVDKEKNKSWIRKYNYRDKLFFIRDNLCHQVIFYRKKVFYNCGFYDENYKIIADYDFNVRAFIVNGHKSKYIKIPIAKFERGGLSTSKDESLNQILISESRKIQDFYFSKFDIKMSNILYRFFGSIVKNLLFRPILVKIFGWNLS